MVLLRRPRSGHWEQGNTIPPPALLIGSSRHLWVNRQSNKWEMELELELILGAESFDKPRKKPPG